MKRYDIAQVRTGGVMVDDATGDYVLYDTAERMQEALELVALTKPTRGVYVLDETDMRCVRAAIAAGVQA